MPSWKAWAEITRGLLKDLEAQVPKVRVAELLDSE